MTPHRRTRDLKRSRTCGCVLVFASVLGLPTSSLAQNREQSHQQNQDRRGGGSDNRGRTDNRSSQRNSDPNAGSNPNAGRDQRSSPPSPYQGTRPAPNQTGRPSYPPPSYPPPSSFVGRSSPSQNSNPYANQQQNSTQAAPRGNQEHLPQWLDRHKSLPLTDQQRALEAEPGFRDLAPQTQQRMHDRLLQLNQMRPEQRQRVMERTEAIERLSPQQRQQVRSAMSNLSSLPPDRRQAVARSFRDLRTVPPQQRESAFEAETARGQFSPAEASTLRDLLSVEPLLPPPTSTGRSSEPPR